MSLPVHGWFRFPAGFSADWVASLVRAKKQNRDVILLDPFAGVGTTVLSGEQEGVPSLGIEAHPFIARIAKAKLLWSTDVQTFADLADRILRSAGSHRQPVSNPPALLTKCYPDQVLVDLFSLRRAWESIEGDTSASELVWLALASILRICSPVGTAPWQYVLPKATKARPLLPYEAFARQISRMTADMRIWQMAGTMPTGNVFQADARTCEGIAPNSISLVVTSPPYANNYDYADAMRLEMTFFGQVSNWSDLHSHARQWLVRSSSQHVSIDRLNLPALLTELAHSAIAPEINDVCSTLATVRLQHGGKKNYHLMVAAYFADMKRVWCSLRAVCSDGADICWVVGDSAPYGIHVPVERWLGQLALEAGFGRFKFEKLRDRNVKWKNRKHRVPLQEGHLWVKA
jgi:hypothetical protein